MNCKTYIIIFNHGGALFLFFLFFLSSLCLAHLLALTVSLTVGLDGWVSLWVASNGDVGSGWVVFFLFLFFFLFLNKR